MMMNGHVPKINFHNGIKYLKGLFCSVRQCYSWTNWKIDVCDDVFYVFIIGLTDVAPRKSLIFFFNLTFLGDGSDISRTSYKT